MHTAILHVRAYDLVSELKCKVLHNDHSTSLNSPQVDFLLPRHAQVNPPDMYGRTCLHMACAEGHVPIVRRLLAAKVRCCFIVCMLRLEVVAFFDVYALFRVMKEFWRRVLRHRQPE